MGTDEKPTNRLMINTTEWDDSDIQNLKRYDSAEYEVITDKDTQEFIKNIINKKDNSEEKNSKRQKWSYDYDKHIFKYGDREIYGKELLKMVSGLNGGITADKIELIENIFVKKTQLCQISICNDFSVYKR